MRCAWLTDYAPIRPWITEKSIYLSSFDYRYNFVKINLFLFFMNCVQIF